MAYSPRWPPGNLPDCAEPAVTAVTAVTAETAVTAVTAEAAGVPHPSFQVTPSAPTVTDMNRIFPGPWSMKHE